MQCVACTKIHSEHASSLRQYAFQLVKESCWSVLLLFPVTKWSFMILNNGCTAEISYPVLLVCRNRALRSLFPVILLQSSSAHQNRQRGRFASASLSQESSPSSWSAFDQQRFSMLYSLSEWKVREVRNTVWVKGYSADILIYNEWMN